jgi:hypothetical protein
MKLKYHTRHALGFPLPVNKGKNAVMFMYFALREIFAMMKKLYSMLIPNAPMWSKLRAFHLSTDLQIFLFIFKFVHVVC